MHKLLLDSRSLPKRGLVRNRCRNRSLHRAQKAL